MSRQSLGVLVCRRRLLQRADSPVVTWFPPRREVVACDLWTPRMGTSCRCRAWEPVVRDRSWRPCDQGLGPRKRRAQGFAHRSHLYRPRARRQPETPVPVQCWRRQGTRRAHHPVVNDARDSADPVGPSPLPLQMVKCWDLETNKVIRHYHGHLSGIYSME